MQLLTSESVVCNISVMAKVEELATSSERVVLLAERQLEREGVAPTQQKIADRLLCSQGHVMHTLMGAKRKGVTVDTPTVIEVAGERFLRDISSQRLGADAKRELQDFALMLLRKAEGGEND